MTVANERSFSRAAEKLARTQPAVSLALQRLESELGEKLLDRSAKGCCLTDAAATVLEYAGDFRISNPNWGIQWPSCAIIRRPGSSLGRMNRPAFICSATSNGTGLVPKGKSTGPAQFSSRIPARDHGWQSGTGRHQLSARDERLQSRVIFTDSLAFVVSPNIASRNAVKCRLRSWATKTFVAHNVLSPYRDNRAAGLSEPRRPAQHGYRDADGGDDRWMVEENQGVAFLPRMTVEQEIAEKRLVAVRVPKWKWSGRSILVQPSRRAVSYAADAFPAAGDRMNVSQK